MTLPMLPLDISVPAGVLARRDAISFFREAARHGIHPQRRGGISVDRTDPNAIFIQMVGPAVSSIRSRHLSESDWLLLETLDTGCQRPLHTGRFLTMHKRRRKRLTTRSLTQEPALLDDIHHGQVQCVLDRVWKWPFNAFTLDTVTGGRSLPVLCVHLFHWYGLMDHFNLDVVRVWKLFTLIEEGYHSTNPYHNSIHATDVTQAMHCFLQEEKIRMHLTPLEIMSALIAAVTHDLDHPGVNQPFLIATSNHLAALYEVTDPNTSVLENHHWRSAVGCLLESNIAEQLGTCRPELEQQISSLILATDITRQQEFLTRFKRYLDQSSLDLHLAEDRHFILQIALKCADISNPCRPWDVSRKWSLKVCEEFFRQGDYERQLNLPVTSLCDRQTTSIPKIQAGFFKFVVSPLFEEWHRFLGTDLSTLMMGFLRGNQCRWEALVQQEIAEETKTEISDAELIDEDVCGSSEDEAEMSGSVELLLPPPPRRPSLPCEENNTAIRVNRRHSVPLSMVHTLPLPRTIIRRESLPVGEHRQHPILPLEEGVVLQPTHSQLSLLSSSSTQHSCSGGEPRPVSAENLLPEPSIASITTSMEASRLSTVLHGAPQLPSRYLTRQQTFPPLQPFIRVRYMSTTAEMSSCSEVLREADSHSESSCSPECEQDRIECASECEVVRGKREQVDSARDKGSKVAKLSESWSAQQHRWEKENVDPQRLGSDADLDYKGGLRRNSHQGLARRRGSAPVGLLNRSEDGISSTALALRGSSDRFLRRGSVPIDVTRQSVLRPLGVRENSVCPPPLCMLRRSSLPYDLVHQTTTTLTSLVDPLTIPTGSRDVENVQRLDNLGNVIVQGTQDNLNVRRGSAPCDIELRRITPGEPMLVRSGSNNGGKSRSRKKVLRRRSSGGPEMFSVEGDGVAWQRWRREVLARRAAELPTDQLARRRGSLPVEVLAATLSAGPTWRKAPSLRRL